MGRRLLIAALAATLGLGAVAEAATLEPTDLIDRDWSVLTMGPDGSWGTGTDPWIITAVARAIAACQEKSRKILGCGAVYESVLSGWLIGIRCGDTNIIAAGPTLEEAEFMADWRERELRIVYRRDLPPCERLVTVGPRGALAPPGGSRDRAAAE